MGTLKEQMYTLECKVSKPDKIANAAATTKDNDLDVWHYRLGHANEQCVKKLASQELATGMNSPKQTKLSFFEGCVADKMK